MAKKAKTEVEETVEETPAQELEVAEVKAKAVEAEETPAAVKKVVKAEPVQVAKPIIKKVPHGKKWRVAAEKIDQEKTYSLAEALDLVKATSTTKFDGTVELHAKTSSTTMRGHANLPHGTGKEKRVEIITADNADELIAKMESGWLDFDVLVATPQAMPKLAKLARALGPKGLMPSPKAGTVSDQPEKVAEELKGGKIEYRADKGGALHQAIGKVSWDTAKLTENLETLLKALPMTQIQTLWLTSTMGPSVRLEKPGKK